MNTATNRNGRADHLAERDASYWLLEDAAPRGLRLQALRDIWYAGRTVKAGDVVVLLSRSNAGFNGITVLARDASGEYVQASAGAFKVAR